jgi:(S)-mandelate dehydrogenase
LSISTTCAGWPDASCSRPPAWPACSGPTPTGCSPLPHPDDAREAVALGADALVVSNHGGSQLDVAPSPLEMLPQVRAAVGEHVELILDSGVRRGSDIVIARCLGARSAIFGRPTLYGIAAGGQAGAARALAIIRREVDTVLAQIGCGKFDDLDAGYLDTKFGL